MRPLAGKLTRAHLVRAVAADCGISIAQARASVGALVEVVADALAEGESVRLGEVGLLHVARARARAGRHPATGLPFASGPRAQVRFRAAAGPRRRAPLSPE